MSNEELKTLIITNLILEYRLSLDSISELLDIDKEDTYNKLINNPKYMIKNALMYVLDYETKEEGLIDQKTAKRKALMFLTKLHMAKDPKEKLDVVKQLSDNSDIHRIKNKTRDQITDEDAKKILNYRCKYALPRQYIIENFDVSKQWIVYQESKLDEQTQRQLKLLNQYNEEQGLRNSNAKRKH